MNADELIEKFQLIHHPEGGYFREVYRSNHIIRKESLPGQYDGDRNLGTSIYFLLRGKEFSAFHWLKSDEIWHFYLGSSVVIHELDVMGQYHRTTVGQDIAHGEILQHTIKAGNHFAAELIDKKGFCLVGCNVFPGFHFDDFFLSEAEELYRKYPGHEGLIKKFTIQ